MYICTVNIEKFNMSTNYLILIFVIILIIFIIIRKLPSLWLLLIKLFYTKYSYRYLNLYKRYTNKNPYSYCIKNEFIYHILMFLDRDKDSVSYKTSKVIKFGDIPYLTTFAEIKKLKGNPVCFNAYKHNFIDVKIIGYKEIMYDIEIKAFYYFIDNIFFMGEYVFKEISHEVVKDIAALIHKDYLDNSEDIVDTDNFYIEDNNDSIIHFGDTGFALIIKYINLADTRINNKIDKVYDEIRKIITKVQKKR